MNCDSCKHMKRIREALAPCQTCEHGRLHGEVSLDSSPCVERRTSPSGDRRTGQVTHLSEDVEDMVRIALSTVFQFDPIEVLLIRHVSAGKSLASFNVTLRELRDRLVKYDLGDGAKNFRFLANKWAKKITDNHPELKSFITSGRCQMAKDKQTAGDRPINRDAFAIYCNLLQGWRSQPERFDNFAARCAAIAKEAARIAKDSGIA